MTASEPIKIMRAGSFTSVEGVQVHVGWREMQGMVASYSALSRRSPIVIGHPANDEPVQGRIASLAMDGDFVVAKPVDVEPGFADLVRARRYQKVSASFFPPTHALNPVPGHWYLKHLGFLGGAAPAVKGLGTVAFAEPIGLDTAFSFAAPAGHRTEAEAEDLYRRAVLLQSRNPGMRIITAVTMVLQQDEVPVLNVPVDIGAPAGYRADADAEALFRRALTIQSENPETTIIAAALEAARETKDA